jgi:hypothetical protein
MHRASLAFVLFAAACGAPAHFEVDDATTAGEVVIPLQLERNRPFLEAEVNGRKVTLLLDLGGEATIGLLPATADAIGASFTGSTKSVSDAFGKVSRSRRYELAQVTLGGWSLRDVEGWEHVDDLSLPSRPVDGILGWRLLEKLGVLVDLPRRRLVLVHGGAAPSSFDPTGWTALPIVPTDDGLRADVLVDAKPRRLVLDTGATWSVMKRGGEPTDPGALVDRGGVPFFRASSVVVGVTELGPLDFAVLDLAHPEGDGILGFNFFAAHPVWIDWPAGRAAVDDATPKPRG